MAKKNQEADAGAAQAPEPPDEQLDLLLHSKTAIGMTAVSIAQASDLVAISNALTVHWLEMNRKFFDRANLRLKATVLGMEQSAGDDDSSMSYYERSDKFNGLMMENAKDYAQQFERFSLSASVLVQRMGEKYGSILASAAQDLMKE